MVHWSKIVLGRQEPLILQILLKVKSGRLDQNDTENQSRSCLATGEQGKKERHASGFHPTEVCFHLVFYVSYIPLRTFSY
jgi:hypothetical protein